MHPSNKFWWFIAFSIAVTLTVFAGMVVFFWRGLSPQEKGVLLAIFKDNLIYPFSAFILLVVGVGFILDGILNNYIIPINKITDDIILIHSINPSHRIQIEAGANVTRLARAINEAASRFEIFERQVRDKIQKAKEEAEEEKNILAAVISGLPRAVLICNIEGRILLYNRQAKAYLSEKSNGESGKDDSGRYVGLGRSIFGLFNKHLITYTLDKIRGRLETGVFYFSSSFVQTGPEGKLVLVELVPILNHQRQLNGFVLTVDDITRQIEHDSRNRQLLQSLMRRFRASLGSIHSAIEAIVEYPSMSSNQMKTFHDIIHQESSALGLTLNRVGADYARQIRTNWPLVPVPAGDLMGMVAEKAREKLDIRIRVTEDNEAFWLKADSYSLLMTFLFLLDQLKLLIGRSEFTCRLTREKNFVLMDLLWEGDSLGHDVLKSWEAREIGIGDEVLPMTCREICRYHEAELFAFFDTTAPAPCLRMMLPAVEEETPEQVEAAPILAHGRPVFYDFDLFHQPGQTPTLEKRRLTELSFTVFDTETTGLDPRGGDEIVSIGAVRMVNNRLLREEIFEQLVDPKRSIPPESTRIHGLDQELLNGRPTIAQVLPWFHRFAEDSVLVAHNAAFDMLMLQLKELQTGIRFTQPVLDTMLLAEIVNPFHSSWQLEDIAQRTGIGVTGRHTALGDALITAELLLKLIPLLENKGIRTLGDAINASRKSFLARLKY